jgi:hypothetical protein
MSQRRVTLILLGAHTRIAPSLCSSCPQGPIGCCTSPPDLSWIDIGRVAALGFVDWLLEERRQGRLTRWPRGLLVGRVPLENAVGTKCAYHGPGGCTVLDDQRSAACNYYVCDEALAGVEENATAAEAASRAWTAQYADWNEAVGEQLGDWSAIAESAEQERAFFVLLGQRFLELSRT